jgi:hypothetical protein
LFTHAIYSVTVPNMNPRPTVNLNTNTSSMPDLSSLLNLPQFQGLVSLAQTNPALFNQLTNSSYFDVSTTTSTPSTVTDSFATPPALSYAGTPNSTPINNGTPVIAPTTAEDLELSLRSLASELGFESDKYSDNANLDYVNMDDFLNTYSK